TLSSSAAAARRSWPPPRRTAAVPSQRTWRWAYEPEPLAPLHAHGRVRGWRHAGDRARRWLLSRGLERQALPGRACGPVRREHRLLVRRRGRAGGARADEGAALLHELVLCAPACARAGGRGRVAHARRPESRLLLLGRLGG